MTLVLVERLEMFAAADFADADAFAIPAVKPAVLAVIDTETVRAIGHRLPSLFGVNPGKNPFTGGGEDRTAGLLRRLVLDARFALATLEDFATPQTTNADSYCGSGCPATCSDSESG